MDCDDVTVLVRLITVWPFKHIYYHLSLLYIFVILKNKKQFAA